MNLQGRDLSIEMNGEDVRLLQSELLQLGFRISPAEIQRHFFGPVTREVVLEFQHRHGLGTSGVVNERTAVRLNAEVDALHRPPPPPSPDEPPTDDRIFTVQVQVLGVDQNPLAGVTVQAFDQDLRNRQRLGDSQATDRVGRCEIRYALAQSSLAEQGTADLVFDVSNREGLPLKIQKILRLVSNERSSVDSPMIIFNAQPVEEVTLIAGEGEIREPSEYEQIFSKVTRLSQGLPLGDLTEDDKHQDITFLSGETGIDPQRIAFLILGARLNRETDLPAEVFYGLFRQKLPTTLPALLAQTPEHLRRALEASIQNNFAPLRLRAELDDVVRRFKELVVRSAFQEPEPGRASLGALLNTAVPSEEIQQRFLTHYVEHKGPVEAFWETLREKPGFENGVVEELQTALWLGAFTRDHMPLVREIQELRRDGAMKSIRDLAKLTESDWRMLIDRKVEGRPVGFPREVPGTDEEEKAATYARTLVRTLEAAFPTAVIAARAAKDDIPLKKELMTFFDKNPEFEFGRHHVDVYLSENQGALAGADDREGLTRQLKGMQRVFKLSPRYEEMRTLMANGFDSAQSVVGLAKETFVEKYGPELGGPPQAAAIYERAEQVTAAALLLFSRFSPQVNSVDTAVTPKLPE